MLTPLNNDLLYLIVFGPGFGESVCLRIPPGHWVVIDGCSRGGNSYPEYMLSLHTADQLHAVILTHPHLDHSKGLRRLVDAGRYERLGCTPPLSPPDDEDDLDNPDRDLNAGVTEDLLHRIWSEWISRPGCRWDLLRGRHIQVEDAHFELFSPEPEKAQAFWQSRKAGGDPEPNEISTAIRVAWHDLRLVLGSDLERLPRESGGNACASSGRA